MLNRDDDILKAAEDWQKAGHGVALATVVETWGSAPRPAGSSLVINDDGTFLGSVSGGCVEGAARGMSGCPAAAPSGCSSRKSGSREASDADGSKY